MGRKYYAEYNCHRGGQTFCLCGRVFKSSRELMVHVTLALEKSKHVKITKSEWECRPRGVNDAEDTSVR